MWTIKSSLRVATPTESFSPGHFDNYAHTLDRGENIACRQVGIVICLDKRRKPSKTAIHYDAPSIFLTLGIFKLYQSTENRLVNAHISLFQRLSGVAFLSSTTPFLAQLKATLLINTLDCKEWLNTNT